MCDASVLVSAALKAESVPGRALLRARSRGLMCCSDATEDELRRVLGRPKFAKYFAPGETEEFVRRTFAGARRVAPDERVADCRDRKDNIYLELALAAGAWAIVSGDADLLVLDPWRGVRALTPAAYLAAMEEGVASRPVGARVV